MDPFRSHLSLAGIAGSAKLVVVRGREALGTPFSYVVDFSADGFDADAARGTRGHLTLIDENGVERHVSGAVERVELAVAAPKAVGERIRARAHLVPEVYLTLSHRHNSRIFQDKDVVAITKAVLEAAGLDGGLLDWSGVQGTYPAREYCVQYDESDWDFVQRLLEEEGIFYAFDHAADGHTMLMLDQNESAPMNEPSALTFNPEPHLTGGPAMVWQWWAEGRITESKSTLRDYDMKRPSLDMEGAVSSDEVMERELYEYPGGYVEPSEGKRLAQVRLDAARTRRRTFSARTVETLLLPGRRFELLGHLESDGEFLVIHAELVVRLEEEEGVGALSDPGEQIAEVAFRAVPADQPFRPTRRTPRPSIPSLQTATVTGPAGEEIHCDEHGRVKVQFHWDREGKLDDASSCWMRVTQAHTTGSVMIPRIGWEVLVSFVDSDPDRPLVLGKLWNPNNPPPVELPGSKTRTAHGSTSSPGGAGVNEVVFDDAAGAETMRINAHHDLNMVVANNSTVSVGRNSNRTVNGSRTASVGGNKKKTVGANCNASIGGDQTLSVGGNRTVKVSGRAGEEMKGDFTMDAAMELVMVGNPVAAVLEVIAAEAIEAASGAAAQAAGRAQAAMLGPIAPALDTARSVVGSAAQYAGPAGALLGGSNPNVAMITEAAGSLSSVAGAADAGSIAAGAARSAMSGAMARASAQHLRGGGGGGGADADPAAASGASGGGSGTWATTVGADLTEDIGGVCVVNSASGVTYTIGGECKELIGAARMEIAKGGKSETTGGNKLETVGVYMIKAGESFGIDAAAAVALNIAGTQKQTISGGHTIAAEGAVAINAPKIKLNGSGTITFKCGPCEVVVKQAGIMIDGAASITLEAKSSIEVDQNALGS